MPTAKKATSAKKKVTKIEEEVVKTPVVEEAVPQEKVAIEPAAEVVEEVAVLEEDAPYIAPIWVHENSVKACMIDVDSGKKDVLNLQACKHFTKIDSKIMRVKGTDGSIQETVVYMLS